MFIYPYIDIMYPEHGSVKCLSVVPIDIAKPPDPIDLLAWELFIRSLFNGFLGSYGDLTELRHEIDNYITFNQAHIRHFNFDPERITELTVDLWHRFHEDIVQAWYTVECLHSQPGRTVKFDAVQRLTFVPTHDAHLLYMHISLDYVYLLGGPAPHDSATESSYYL